MVTAYAAKLKPTALTHRAFLSSTFAVVDCWSIVMLRDARIGPGAGRTPRIRPEHGVKRLIMGILPPTVRAHAREMRRLSGRARRVHLTLALRRWAFADAPAIPASASATTRVLFVCHGNIIRSALAEGLLRHHFTRAGVSPLVRSAGVAATLGRAADPRAVNAARELGIDLTAHRATPLTRDIVDASDLIFIMDRLNEAEVLARFPNARGKLRRLGSLAMDAAEGDVIPDPYSLDGNAVDAAARRIDDAVRELTALMLRGRAGVTP